LILAIGHQDTDILGLSMPDGNVLIGATSDHLVIGAQHAALRVGSEMRFQMNYSALMRAMAAPDVGLKLLRNCITPHRRGTPDTDRHLALV
jgi:predicted amino acid racemase